MNSTPLMLEDTMRPMAFEPPPPIPITLMLAIFSASIASRLIAMRRPPFLEDLPEPLLHARNHLVENVAIRDLLELPPAPMGRSVHSQTHPGGIHGVADDVGEASDAA